MNDTSSPTTSPWAAGADLPAAPKALYRDDNGRLHMLSAICPHLGCIVKWNAVEASWDCPCHGSRFTPDGRVLNGPALTALAPLGS